MFCRLHNYLIDFFFLPPFEGSLASQCWDVLQTRTDSVESSDIPSKAKLGSYKTDYPSQLLPNSLCFWNNLWGHWPADCYCLILTNQLIFCHTNLLAGCYWRLTFFFLLSATAQSFATMPTMCNVRVGKWKVTARGGVFVVAIPTRCNVVGDEVKGGLRWGGRVRRVVWRSWWSWGSRRSP